MSGNTLVFNNGGASNIDHIWHDDAANAFNFVSDGTLKGTANSTLCAGSVSTSGDITAAGDLIAKDDVCICGGAIQANSTVSFLNGGGANPINVACLLTSPSYACTACVPSGGIWSSGNICSATCVRAPFLYSEGQSCAATCLVSPTVKGTTTVCVGSIPLQNSTDRPGLLEINRYSINTWTGIQVNHNTRLWSWMANDTTAGLYDDSSSEWHIQSTENGATCLYNNGLAKFYTRSDGTCTLGIARATSCHCAPTGCFTTCARASTLCASSLLKVAVGLTGIRTCLPNSCGCAVDWIATSDCRRKKDIVPYECGLDKINHLMPVCYTWCQDDTHDMGFIAQDVKEVEPRLVVGSDKEGYGLKYDKFAALAVKAIQELSCEVKCLKCEIEKLKKE